MLQLTIKAMLLICALGVVLPAVAQPAGRSVHTDYDQRMAWFRDARFGMFIHFGLYSVPAGVWEGSQMGFGEYFGFRVDRDAWADLTKQFNPVEFDADAIARAAKDAGMKYLVITSKHHDGFCLFDSKHTEFDVMSTPFKRDIIGELAESCRKHGLRFGFYYSIIDLHHLDYLPRPAGDKRPVGDADFDRYVKFMKNQLRELLTNYGPIDVVWFDGEWESSWNHERAKDMWDYIREIDPDVLINNRIDKGRAGMAGMNKGEHFLGDYGTPEQMLLKANPGVDWETCQTMNVHGNWGWRTNESNYYSQTELIQQVVTTASLGGNLLLNIGPNSVGSIPEPQKDRLDSIGQWMQRHSHAIYGSKPSPYSKAPKWGRTTVKGSTLYCHVMDWPKDGQLVLPPTHGNVMEVRPWLGQVVDRLPHVVDEGGLITIDVSSMKPSKHVTVIAVRLDQEPAAPPFRVSPDEQGRLVMNAEDAAISAGSARYDSEKQSIGAWTEATTSISWPIHITKPGRYRVEVTYGVAEGEGGTYAISLGEHRITAKSHSTGGWFKRETKAIGELKIEQAGERELRVSIVDKPGIAVFDFQSVVLTPIK